MVALGNTVRTVLPQYLCLMIKNQLHLQLLLSEVELRDWLTFCKFTILSISLICFILDISSYSNMLSLKLYYNWGLIILDLDYTYTLIELWLTRLNKVVKCAVAFNEINDVITNPVIGGASQHNSMPVPSPENGEESPKPQPNIPLKRSFNILLFSSSYFYRSFFVLIHAWMLFTDVLLPDIRSLQCSV